MANPDFPKAYQKGEVVFLGEKIKIGRGIFIPREETEFWVGKAIKKIKREKIKKERLSFLDIFSGSGCIGISLLKNFDNSFVTFADISSVCLRQIKENLVERKIPNERFKIVKSNLFENIKRKYDFILANPPYVALKRIDEVQESVLRFEPYAALFAGEDGLSLIKKFLSQARNYLKEKGKVFLEFDPLQKKEIANILKKNKFSNFHFFEDQFGKYRWLEAGK